MSTLILNNRAIEVLSWFMNEQCIIFADWVHLKWTPANLSGSYYKLRTNIHQPTLCSYNLYELKYVLNAVTGFITDENDNILYSNLITEQNNTVYNGTHI